MACESWSDCKRNGITLFSKIGAWFVKLESPSEKVRANALGIPQSWPTL